VILTFKFDLDGVIDQAALCQMSFHLKVNVSRYTQPTDLCKCMWIT